MTSTGPGRATRAWLAQEVAALGYRVGGDVGGTFTDLVLVRDGAPPSHRPVGPPSR